MTEALRHSPSCSVGFGFRLTQAEPHSLRADRSNTEGQGDSLGAPALTADALMD